MVGYRAIGYAFWQGSKWYLRHRFPGLGRKLVIAGAAGILLTAAGAAAASQRRSATD